MKVVDKDASEKMKSKHLFAIKAEAYLQKTPKPIVFVLVDGIVILIFQNNVVPVYDAI